MGIFDSSTTSESSLKLPEYLQGIPGALAGQLQGLIGQDYLSPDQLVAQWSDAQTQGVNNLIGSGQEQMMMGQALTGAGLQGLQGFGQGQELLRDVAGQGAVQNMGIDPARMQQYMPQDQIDASINAALRDPTRQFTEQQLPGARLAAASSGNTGSSRRGVGEAVLQRGFEDRAADIGAGIRGQYEGRAFNQLANEASQNAQLGANYQGLQSNIGNALIGSGVQAGNLVGAGNALNLSGIGSQIQGGQMQTGYQQDLLNAGRDAFMFPYQQLQMLGPLAGQMAQTYGTQVNTQSQNNGIGNTILGGALGLGSAALMGGVNPFSMFGGGGGGSSFDPAGIVPFRPT